MSDTSLNRPPSSMQLPNLSPLTSPDGEGLVTLLSESQGREQADLLRHFIGPSVEPFPHDIQAFFDMVLQIGINFKTQSQVKATGVVCPSSKAFQSMPEEGLDSYMQLVEAFSGIIQASSNWASPDFIGFPDAGNAVPALGAALLVPLINQNLANQDICAPSASFIEMEVVHWLREQLGYPLLSSYTTVREIGGVLTLGGCLSNTIALMAAREFVFPGSGSRGLPILATHVKVLVPDIIEHYSVRSAMAWLGMGEENVVRVPVDNLFRLKVDQLGRLIEEEREKGNYILACVAYAGDSRSMRIDDLERIAKMLKSKRVWFHVDACHGSQLAFSKKHRHKIRGIRDADSVTIDPHKVLWIPNTCSFVLFKNPTSLANISTNSDLILKTQWSLGQITPCIGSKAFDALKIWSLIKFFGRSGIERLIDARIELTKAFQTAISKRSNLVLLNDTDINSCIFVFMPSSCHAFKLSTADLEKVNACNLFIKSQITENGDAYLHGFNLKRCSHTLLPDDKVVYVLRTMNGNPLTTLEHLDHLLDTVISLGQRFFTEKQYFLRSSPLSLENTTVFPRLAQAISSLLGDIPHTALIYGSSTAEDNMIQSDIDLMIFAPDSFCSRKTTDTLKGLILHIFAQESIVDDAEIPYERKLLIPISFAIASAKAVPFHTFPLKQINKSTEYLESDEMIHRLVFNVLTVPTVLVSGSWDVVSTARDACERRLVDVISTIIKLDFGEREIDATLFASEALGKEERQGEAFLGYKNRPQVVTHLQKIFSSYPGMTPPQIKNNHSPPLDHHRIQTQAQLHPTIQLDRLSSKRVHLEHEKRLEINQQTLPPTTRQLHYTTQKSHPHNILPQEKCRSNLKMAPIVIPSVPPCIILLNGFPGVGKFTIAKALALQIPTSSHRLIDNHLLIDPVQAIEPGRNPAHYKLRKQIRDIAFNALKEAPDPNLVITMTACLAASENDIEQFTEYADIARARGVPFFNFNIICKESVNAERMCSEERTQGQEKGKSKLVDQAMLEKIREEHKLLDPQEFEMDGQGLTLFYRVLDTSDDSAEETAAKIIEEVYSCVDDIRKLDLGDMCVHVDGAVVVT